MINAPIRNFFVVLALLGACTPSKHPMDQVDIKIVTTTFDKTNLLKAVDTTLTLTDSLKGVSFEIDTAVKYQTMDGFGFALTGGSAYLIQQKLTSPQKDSLLNDLFSTNGTQA